MDKKSIKFAGLNNPYWIIRKNKKVDLIPLKPANIVVTGNEKKPFDNLDLKFQYGNCIYLFSRGCAYRFGITEGKYFKYKIPGDQLFMLKQSTLSKQKNIFVKTLLE